MLGISVLLESGDAPQEFFDRHIYKVRYARIAGELRDGAIP